MINLQKLRHLSCICAYCNKVIPMKERTNDHLIPRCAGGETEIKNIVICCSNCNSLKGSIEINKFLQMENNDYSTAIINNLSNSLTHCKKQGIKKEFR